MALNKYQAFVKVAELGSITKAAEAMGYTQSAVSRMVADLEDEWNLNLLRRSRGGLALSSDGLMLLPFLGWTGGTILGALAGSVLPEDIRTALGVMLYGMFIAIVVPPAKREKPVLVAVLLALLCSSVLDWVPLFRNISAGIAIVISTVSAAAAAAVLFPIKEEEAA